MSGFSFPPPPPPPPKIGQVQGAQYHGQSDYPARGRGHGRRRGRGPAVRGGNPAPRGQHLGSRGNSFNDIAQGRWQHHSTGSINDGSSFDHASNVRTQPTGAYVNHHFGTSQTDLQREPLDGKYVHAELGQNAQAQPHKHHNSPPRTAAGHKRKLDALRGPNPPKNPPPPTAPSVPSFGVPVLPQKLPEPTNATSEKSLGQPKQKPSTNRLGLTPANGDAQYSSSDSEADDREIDEEAMHAELGDKLTFEHNGVVMSLNSQADLVAWKRERQKKWPSTARITEKDEERRRIGEERKRLLSGASASHVSKNPPYSQSRSDGGKAAVKILNTNQTAPQTIQPISEKEAQTELEKVRLELAEQTKHLEELRRRVVESTARNRKAQSQGEAPTSDIKTSEDRAHTTMAEEGTALFQTNIAQSSDLTLEDMEGNVLENGENGSLDSSSVSSDSSPEQDSNDDAPEEISSKSTIAPVSVAQTPVCKYFAARGYCRDGDNCNFRHERAGGTSNVAAGPQAVSKRGQTGVAVTPNPRLAHATVPTSIYQRLMEQEQDEQDRLALKVIKYLGQAGFFADRSNKSNA